MKELKYLGLNNYESKALKLLLETRANMKQISKNAKIPFGKVYSTIKSLKEKNLVKETNSRPKLIYIENASKIISKLLERKKKKDIKIFSELRKIVSNIDNTKKNKVKFFDIGTTNNDNKYIQLRTFKEAKKEVLQILNINHKPIFNRTNKTLWEKEIKRTIKRNVKFKVIYPKEIKLPLIIKNISEKYPKKFKIKRINTNFTRCDIIDDDKILIKLIGEDPLQFGGVLFIEDEKLNENLKKIFYNLWESE
jgi:sugar-specific transcriptional regulator TrmB